MDEPLRKSIDDDRDPVVRFFKKMSEFILRTLIELIRALIELIDPNDDAIVRDLTQLASEKCSYEINWSPQ